ncbi:HAD family hydrolase [Chelativorans xinjiangense]|uniref:HAD family hydrolase n=1 Tax=Chelativorans xinjiangense TaxID=2681485 RepID=UPI00135A3DC4|nr:HAD-IA family hydrolase [Chelativorans xinjiangense]
MSQNDRVSGTLEKLRRGAAGADYALARAHMPLLMLDAHEPYPPLAMGYTVFREPGQSPSSKFQVRPLGGAVIEYAVWYDWDIGHMYDLEHVWVYLDGTGKVERVEASRHGRRLAMTAEGGAIANESLLPASPEPPPLTPPHKGEGDSEASAPPSPLRGGVRGGGTSKDSKSIRNRLAADGRLCRMLGPRPVLYVEAGKHAHWADPAEMEEKAGRLISVLCNELAAWEGVHLGNVFAESGRIAPTAFDHRLAKLKMKADAFEPTFEFDYPSHMGSESLMAPPPLTLPLKGEGDSEASAPPSPLRGGVRGGGSGKAGKDDLYSIALPESEGEETPAAMPRGNGTGISDNPDGGRGIALVPWPILEAWIPARVRKLIEELPSTVPHIRAVLFDCGDTIADEATEEKLPGSEVVVRAELIPGAADMVRHIAAAGYRLALVADGPRETFENILKPAGLWDLFQARIISGEVGALKPSPKMFAAALERLGLRGSEARSTVMIGNNLSRDIKGANAFGIPSIFFGWSRRRTHEPADDSERPDYSVFTPSDVLPLLHEIEAAMQQQNVREHRETAGAEA